MHLSVEWVGCSPRLSRGSLNRGRVSLRTEVQRRARPRGSRMRRSWPALRGLVSYPRARQRCGELLEASSEVEIAPWVLRGLGLAVPRSWVVGRVRIGPLWSLERIWAPRESCRNPKVSGCRVTMKLSSLVALLTISRLGDFFLSKIAVE